MKPYFSFLLAILIYNHTQTQNCMPIYGEQLDGYICSPNGTVGADGTISDPMDLRSCLRGDEGIPSSGKVYLLPGIYDDPQPGIYGLYLDRTYLLNLPGVDIQPAHGRYSAQINGGFKIVSANTRIFDLYFFNSDPVPGGEPTPPGSYPIPTPVGWEDWGSCGAGLHGDLGGADNSAIINCISNGGAGAYGSFQSENTLLYGNIAYNYGWHATDRDHGHGIYGRGYNGTPCLMRHNLISSDKYGRNPNSSNQFCIHAFGTGIDVSHTHIIENALKGHSMVRSESFQSRDIIYKGNVTAGTHPTEGCAALMGKATLVDFDINFEDNTFINAFHQVRTVQWQTVANDTTTRIYKANPLWTYGPNPWVSLPANELGTFYDISGGGGIDEFRVWPNEYDSNRVTIIILDLDLNDSVKIDPSSFLTSGDSYDIYHYKNALGTPNISGVWSTEDITIPLIDLSTDRMDMFFLVKCTTIIPSMVGFSSSDSSICSGSCISFNDLSTNSISRKWYFPGSTLATSTDENPSNVCYNNPGTYAVSMVAINAHGQDSIFKNNFITVNPVYNHFDTLRVCPSELPVSIHGNDEDTTGTYVQTFTSVDGCDSTENITLIIKSDYSTSLPTIEACDSALVNGTWYYSSQTVRDTLLAINSCDSVITIPVVIHNSYALNEIIEVCANELPVSIHGQDRTDPGTYTFTYISSKGCDSIVETNLVVRDSPTTNLPEVLGCDSALVNGTWYYTSIVLKDTLTTVHGCDSIVNQSIVVHLSYEIFDTLRVCSNELPVQVHGQDWSNAGTYSNTYTSIGGCDSTVHFTLEINNVLVTNMPDVVGCDSAIVNGNVYYNDQVVKDTLQRVVLGCDSVLITQVRIFYSALTVMNVDFCEGDSVAVAEKYYNSLGIFYDTLQGSNGCDSTLAIQVGLLMHEFYIIDTNLCNRDELIVAGEIITQDGIYNDTLVGQAANGCNVINEYDVTILPDASIEAFTGDSLVCLGDTAKLEASGGVNYEWLDPANQTGNPIHVSPDETTIYTVLDSSLCANPTAQVEVFVMTKPILFIPNAFSPNQKNDNELFEIKARGVENFHIQIYDRWGNKTFESDNMDNCWNGSKDGKPYNEGAFIYHINMTLKCHGEINKQGGINIIK